MNKKHRYCLLIATGFTCTLRGQIIPEGHSSPLPGNHMIIPGSLGTRVGTNLFHGFSAFSIPKGQSATFTASPSLSISNVIARVSGGSPTKIEGLLRSDIPGANLFLMNPNGVFFGPGARLDVSGAFVATTANSIDLGKDGGRFFADPAEGASALACEAPSAFGFLSSSPAPIEVTGARLEALRESTGLPARTVALIGGDISLKGAGSALAGDSVIVSVGGAGRIHFDARDAHSVPLLEGFDSLGAISLSGSLVTASADSGEIGGIDMIGRSLALDHARIISRNGDLVGAPPIRLAVAEDMTLTNRSEIVTTGFPDAGGSADLFIRAGSLTMDALGGTIASEVAADSSAGSIHIHVSSEIRIGGSSSILSNVSPNGVAPGGAIEIEAGRLAIDGENSVFHSGVRSQTGSIHGSGRGGDVRLSISDGIFVTRQGSIDALTEPGSRAGSGSIDVKAGDVVLDGGEFPDGMRPRVTGINSSTSGAGDAGRISVKADSLSIGGGALIDSGSKLRCPSEGECPPGGVASGNGGEIDISARRVSIDGRFVVDSNGVPLRTGIVNFTGEGRGRATGDSGNIRVSATESIRLLNGGLIDSSTFQTGNAGDVTVSAREILIDRGGRGIFTGIGSDTELAEEGGRAGNVSVEATGSLILRNGGLISAATFGSGDAGNVVVKAGEIRISGSGKEDASVVVRESGIVAVTGEESKGKGGNVRVEAHAGLSVRDGGLIAAQALGTGKGGRVDVAAADIRLNGGAINALARSGGAGELRVTATGDIMVRNSLLSATAGGDGRGGDVAVRGRNVMITGGGAAQSGGILASTLAGSSGDGGNVRIVADDALVIEGERVAAESLGRGRAGSVLLRGGEIRLGEGSRLSVIAAQGDAGALRLRASGDLIAQGATISANAGNDGGNVRIDAGGLIHLRGSDVSADAGGSGGNIEFRGARHLVLDRTPVSASAVDRDGGSILISTGTFFANNSPLSVTSERGKPGTVRIETIHALSGGEEAREADWLDPDDVLQPSCAERRPDAGSSFTRGGRGGAQRLPGGHLPAFRLIQ